MRLLFLAILGLVTLPAATLVSVTGPEGGGVQAGANQAITAGFTLGQNYSNVSISAYVRGFAGEPVNAFLTDQIGPGTTQGTNEVATTSFQAPSMAAFTTIFTGLNLNAGTYYLTLYSADYTSSSAYASDAPVFTTAPGSSFVFSGYAITEGQLGNYAPAFNYADFANTDRAILFLVETVDGAEVPEPAAYALVGVGLLVLARVRRR